MWILFVFVPILAAYRTFNIFVELRDYVRLMRTWKLSVDSVKIQLKYRPVGKTIAKMVMCVMELSVMGLLLAVSSGIWYQACGTILYLMKLHFGIVEETPCVG